MGCEWNWQTGLGAKTLRAAALLPSDFVVAVVTARYGDAPTAPPRSRPKSPAGAPFPLFRQAPSVLMENGRCGGHFTPKNEIQMANLPQSTGRKLVGKISQDRFG